MRKIGADIGHAIAEMGGNSEEARINMRTRQVLERYRTAIESVYPRATARLHLEHTNKVIIKDVRVVGRNGESAKVRTLIVYVDDSLFSAELNAQRELIKLQLLEQFGEDVEDFVIRVSGRKEYRAVHPYADEEELATAHQPEPIPLNGDERAFVSRTVAVVEDKKLKKALERAMTADMEWKKGEKLFSDAKNPK